MWQLGRFSKIRSHISTDKLYMFVTSKCLRNTTAFSTWIYYIPRVNNVWRRILLPLATSLRWIQKVYSVVNNPCEIILCVIFLLFNWATSLITIEILWIMVVDATYNSICDPICKTKHNDAFLEILFFYQWIPNP